MSINKITNLSTRIWAVNRAIHTRRSRTHRKLQSPHNTKTQKPNNKIYTQTHTNKHKHELCSNTEKKKKRKEHKIN